MKERRSRFHGQDDKHDAMIEDMQKKGQRKGSRAKGKNVAHPMTMLSGEKNREKK